MKSQGVIQVFFEKQLLPLWLFSRRGGGLRSPSPEWQISVGTAGRFAAQETTATYWSLVIASELRPSTGITRSLFSCHVAPIRLRGIRIVETEPKLVGLKPRYSVRK